MGAVNRDSTIYGNRYTNKYLGDARTGFGNLVPFPFELTVVSASTVGDTYNLFVLPANWRMTFLFCTTDGLGASAGAGRTLSIGDSGSATRFMLATDFDVSGAQGFLAAAGVGYTPTADTIVLATSAGGAWVVGKKAFGIALALAPAG